MKRKISLRKLNAAGIAHFIAPLVIVLAVGVVGTYMLVASHANSVSKKSYMVVYSETGAYDAVSIKLTGSDGKKRTCGGSLGLTNTITKKLPGANKKTTVYSPLKVTCSAIAGSESYEVSYGKNGDFTTAPVRVAVDIDKGYCTFVHPDATKITKAKYENGKCKDVDSQNDTPTKVDVAVRTLPALNKAKNDFTGYIDFTIPGKNITRAQCVGEVKLQFVEASTPNTIQSTQLPLKYVGKSAKVKNSYCVAKINPQAVKPKAGNYSLTAIFAGNLYFNAVNSEAKNVVIPVPKTR